MGIFSDHAVELFECGFSIIPLAKNQKKPIFQDWSKYCHQMPEPEQVDEWCEKYPDYNIGVCLGPASGIIAFDLDTDNEKVKQIIESHVTPSPVIRWGKKGYVGFYKFSGQRSTSFEGIMDFLSTGRQVVLPPSIHPDTKNPYQWLSFDTLTAIDKDDLPEFTDKLFQELCGKIKLQCPELIKEKKLGKGARNEYLKKFVATNWDTLEFDDIVERTIIFDQLAHKDKALFKDKKEFPKCKNQTEAAIQFCSSIGKTIERLKEQRGEGENKTQPKKSSFNQFKYLFDYYLINSKKNILTGEVLQKKGKEWKAVLNMNEILKSYAIDEKYQDGKTTAHLERWCDECVEPELIVDHDTVWDKRDHVEEIFKHLKFKNISTEHATVLFKEWAANIFSRLDNGRNQNHFLIFKGAQGKGKDTLIQNLCDGFGMYFQNFTIDRTPKENYQTMSESLVLNVAEFDQTAAFQVSFLKDMVTKDSAKFRAPYARLPESINFHCSFISTCNVDDILRDSTGNRRYMIFEVEEINWTYPKDRSRQLFAQYKALHDAKYKASVEARGAMNEFIVGQTPDNLDDLVMESWEAKIDDLCVAPINRTKDKFSYPCVIYIIIHAINNK